MKVRIPDNTTELTLKQYQFLMGNLNTNVERGEYIIKHFSKRDPDKFDDDTKSAVFLTMMKLFENEGSFEPEKEIEDYRIPSELLKIRVGHFIEIVNANIDQVSMVNAEMLMGCFYRKDWDKDFSEEEILSTAEFFQTRPLRETIGGVILMSRLIQRLKDIYPLLYDDKVNEEAEIEKTEDEGRRLYDMLMGLANGEATKMFKAKCMRLGDAFVYLEELKKEKIKERLNAKNKNR